jgi:hypothetical protein
VHGAVEPEVVTQRRERRRVGMPLDHARGDVARHQPHHRKDDDAHEEQRRNREGEAAKEVALHLSGQVYA